MSLIAKIKGRDNPLFLFLVLTGLALLVRYVIAMQDIAYLDRLFIPDDAYYILSISHSIVAGLGPSVDGVQLTNGFQPLISLLQLPIFLFGFNGDSAVVLAVYLSAFWGGLSTFCIRVFTHVSKQYSGSNFWLFVMGILPGDYSK